MGTLHFEKDAPGKMGLLCYFFYDSIQNRVFIERFQFQS